MPAAVSAIIVNYNQRDLVVAAVKSVEEALDNAGERGEIVVVDNGSIDGSVERLAIEAPHTVVVSRPDNPGFAAGVAAGLEVSTGEWVFLLNNDARVDRTCLRILLNRGRVAGAERLGALAPQVVFADDPTVINAAGLSVDRLGIGFDRKVGQRIDAADRPEESVFGASGGAALLRRAMIDDVGGFDTSYFMYYEDVDLAWRARGRGWESLYVPAALVYHDHSLSVGHGTSQKHFHVGRNRIRTLAKNATTRHLLRYGAGILAYDLAHSAYVLVRQRTLAPVRGRIAGLREWRRYRSPGSEVELGPIEGVAAALSRSRVWRQSSGGARPRALRPPQ